MSKRKSGGRFGGKGYYIALVLCAVAIGVSGYLYYRNMDPQDAALEKDAVSSQQEDVGVSAQVAATVPDAPAEKDETKPAGSQVESQSLKTAAPLSGETVAEYAMDCLSYNQTTRDWRVHNGVDIAAEAGTQVCAAADGTVYTVYDDDTMGKTVVIRHTDGYVTKYASLAEEVSVTPGQQVKMGQVIGCVGQTALLESAIGDHVHFSVTCNDEVVDPQAFLSLG